MSQLTATRKVAARKDGARTLVDLASLKTYYAALPLKTDHAPLVFGRRAHVFTDETVASLRVLLDPLVTRRPPVATAPKPNSKWIEPIVKVRTLHRGGLNAERVRQPIFEGLSDQA